MVAGLPTLPQAPIAQQHPDPQKVQEELLAKYQAVYADYAAGVAKVERETSHISAKHVLRRQQFYWTPLNKYATDLQEHHQINGYQLAQIVNQGLEEKWPTQTPSDGEAVARMFRRIRTEQTTMNRRLQAQADMACLEALCDAMAASATAAATAGGPVVIGGGVRSGGIMPPIFTEWGAVRSWNHGRVRIGQPTSSGRLGY
jgi:hypothetical protein